MHQVDAPVPLTLNIRTESFAYKQPFRISGHLFTQTEVIVAELSDGIHIGRGEAAGVYYLGDDLPAMLTAVEQVRGVIERGATRTELQSLLPPGGARNALDCAYWELESKQAGMPVWELAGLQKPRSLRTTLTIGADSPQAMALASQNIKTIKLKLTGDVALDAARVIAVRAARPDAWIAVDANQGYNVEDLGTLTRMLVEQKIALLEQPLPRGNEADLDGIGRPLPFAADESAVSLAEIGRLAGRFDVVNIKLDKCGGLTEGLAMAARAKQMGLGVMVGNMMGSSLSMAPSFVLGQLCDVVDLDGPTFLKEDRFPSVAYQDGHIWCDEVLWGFARDMLQPKCDSDAKN